MSSPDIPSLRPDTPKPSENIQIVPRALFFDADGVITNHRSEVEPKVLDFIAKFIQRNEPVVINSGRTVAWVNQYVTEPLTAVLAQQDKTSAISNFAVSAEMGAFMVFFDEKGDEEVSPAEGITFIADDLRQEVSSLIDQKYGNTFFDGELKESYLAPQRRLDLPLELEETYEEDKLELKIDLEKLIGEKGLANSLIVQDSNVALVLHDRKLGKDFGVQRGLDWLNQKGIKPSEIIAFGDSPTDIAMTEKAHQEGIPTTFVYVGKREQFKGDYPFHTIFPSTQYSSGTLEFLESLEKES